MTRVIVHAGFHKTGTTSLQKFFDLNKAALGEHISYFGQHDIELIGARSKAYAQKPFPWRLRRYRKALDEFLGALPDTETLVLSRETFAGVMPGHRDWRGKLIADYSAAQPLCKTLVKALQHRFGPDTSITFLLTTRAPEPWLRSVYGHLLRSIRLTEDYTSFQASFARLKPLEEEADALATSLAPHPVVTASLEETSSHPEGPASALLDVLSLPEATRKRLRPVPAKNTANARDLQDAFLKLNREIKDKARLKKEKEALLKRQHP